jgi:membrane protease YdiL (CAAX protease family)
LLWGLQYLGQEGFLPEWLQIFGMFGLFGPFIAFLILIKKDDLRYRVVFRNLFKKPPIWTILFVVISPFVLSGISYIVYRFFVDGNPQPLGVTLASFLPIALMILFVGGPVEEFGWRGYLLPKLREKYSFIVTILLLGMIHGVWHIPLHYLNGTVQEAIPIYEFVLITVAITVSYVFVYEYTKSLIPFIVLHWAANFSSAVFPYFYNIQGRYALLIVTLVLDAILIIIHYSRKKRRHNLDA